MLFGFFSRTLIPGGISERKCAQEDRLPLPACPNSVPGVGTQGMKCNSKGSHDLINLATTLICLLFRMTTNVSHLYLISFNDKLT